MGFLGVYKAVYDYAPQSAGELSITEGDILYVLEKSGEDDWWRAKKKASGDDDDEPVGLIPNNYIEEVCMRWALRPHLTVWARENLPTTLYCHFEGLGYLRNFLVARC